MKFTTCVSLIAICVRATAVSDTRHVEKGLLGKILGDEVSYPLRPAGSQEGSGSEWLQRTRKDTVSILSSGPVSIAIAAFVRDVVIEPGAQTMKCTVEIIETWLDKKLGFDSFKGKVNAITIVESSDGINRIWQTETVILNGETQNGILGRLRIYPSGHVERLLRFEEVHLPCYVDNPIVYPFHGARCVLRIGSMAHIKEEVAYLWNSTYGIRIDETIRPQNLYLSRISLRAANMLMPAKIEHSFIEATFTFKSNRFDLLCRFLFPCIFCVFLGFFSFLEILRARSFIVIWMATILLSVTVSSWPPAICAFQLASILAVVSYAYLVATMFVSLCGADSDDHEATSTEQCPVKKMLASVVPAVSTYNDLIIRIALSSSYFCFVIFYAILINKTT